jgi:cellulose synthase/poly-beta-1,6-N-acetylglucosamine synthase-like glycosyltransferase
MRPLLIPDYIVAMWNIKGNSKAQFDEIKSAYSNLSEGIPQVTIIIPAYNEEDTIVKTLASLCYNVTRYTVEIIVVNNNSRDRTEEFVKACGVTCITESKQGIVHARNSGLKHAKGEYIINADADTIYPETYIDSIVNPLVRNNKIAITYGGFSLIPIGGTSRLTYFIYEHLADTGRFVNKVLKPDAYSVYGFNSAFRKNQGREVNGFDFPPGASEDAFLAVKLRNKGFGSVYLVSSESARAWTTDRRILIDGGLYKGTLKRLKRIAFRR